MLDEGISGEFSPGGEDEMSYGDVPLAPLIFQDDVIHTVGGLREARLSNEKTDGAVKTLNLTLNQDKTTFLIIGSRKQKQSILKELEEKPLMCSRPKCNQASSGSDKLCPRGACPSRYLQQWKQGLGKSEGLAWK